ncbi:MAG: hypothetical protein KF885_05640 [Anaerolineales bacterium]|nr:hypothetical protein [Anaerolineales bacterium]
MNKYLRMGSFALAVALVFSLAITSAVFAQGTIPSGGTIDDPEVTPSREGCARNDFGSSKANVCNDDVNVFATRAVDSTLAPAGWSYAGNSMTITYGDELLLPEATVMCWAVPAGAPVQIYRLNQYGVWEPAPTIAVDGGVCTVALYTGTYAPMAAD